MRRDQSPHHLPTLLGWFISEFYGGSGCSIRHSRCLEGYLKPCGLFVALGLFSSFKVLVFASVPLVIHINSCD
ncbi:hypothetical protein L195_g046213 [Trifolium pratense]|uniref:Uncharacterized protein n=1 Tax=Trifolium pratense TaxID=57577 RepID=A0A2K3MH12_TRIPR|nr:hypothetical protein L195_g046213 [Trifolium pratense]